MRRAVTVRSVWGRFADVNLETGIRKSELSESSYIARKVVS
jgi:hypothetical protein